MPVIGLEIFSVGGGMNAVRTADFPERFFRKNIPSAEELLVDFRETLVDSKTDPVTVNR